MHLCGITSEELKTFKGYGALVTEKTVRQFFARMRDACLRQNEQHLLMRHKTTLSAFSCYAENDSWKTQLESSRSWRLVCNRLSY